MPRAQAPTPTQRQKQRKAARESAATRAKRREIMLEFVARGMERATIANEVGVSVRTVYREVNRALDERTPMSADRFVRLQVERLNRTLLGLDVMIDRGNARAAAPLLAILDRLDRYHGLQAATEAAAAPRALAPPPAAPLALTRDSGGPEADARTETAMQIDGD